MPPAAGTVARDFASWPGWRSVSFPRRLTLAEDRQLQFLSILHRSLSSRALNGAIAALNSLTHRDFFHLLPRARISHRRACDRAQRTCRTR